MQSSSNLPRPLPTSCRAPRGKTGGQKISSPSLGFVAEKFLAAGLK